MTLTAEHIHAVRAEFRDEEARLVMLDANRRATSILRRLKRDPDEVIAQRRADLEADLRRLHRRQRRDRITRQAARHEWK